ncbi:hypothetical protein PVAP13_6KG179906 [Panicum virgatum]|uniref:Uncharacterized protein n=1 Tax=Panicum virgatum TaxID=38727 RepID=A0A8T0RAI8_PANVG|nr:hypothetical protein PVAP13_6KG179906 [Panicum virgatum]
MIVAPPRTASRRRAGSCAKRCSTLGTAPAAKAAYDAPGPSVRVSDERNDRVVAPMQRARPRMAGQLGLYVKEERYPSLLSPALPASSTPRGSVAAILAMKTLATASSRHGHSPVSLTAPWNVWCARSRLLSAVGIRPVLGASRHRAEEPSQRGRRREKGGGGRRREQEVGGVAEGAGRGGGRRRELGGGGGGGGRREGDGAGEGVAEGAWKGI